MGSQTSSLIYVTIDEVKGFYLVSDVFSEEQYEKFNNNLNYLNGGNVCPQIHHAIEFGWNFLPLRDYDGTILPRTTESYIGEMPDLIKEIWRDIWLTTIQTNKELPQSLLKCAIPDHLLINTYTPGDGCRPHTDELEFWEDWVVGVSFGSGCVMTLSYEKNKTDVYIPPNSVYIFTKDARYKWKHGIPFVCDDNVNGVVVPRQTRKSLTFRNIHKNWLPDSVRTKTKCT